MDTRFIGHFWTNNSPSRTKIVQLAPKSIGILNMSQIIHLSNLKKIGQKLQTAEWTQDLSVINGLKILYPRQKIVRLAPI